MPEGEPTRLASALAADSLAVLAEMTPLATAEARLVEEQASRLGPVCDAICLADNVPVAPQMNPISAAVICLMAGFEPVLQVGLRGRTRPQLEAALLGAGSHGIRNVVPLRGLGALDKRDPTPGRAIKLIAQLRAGKLHDECPLVGKPPDFFVGAPASPAIEEKARASGLADLVTRVRLGARYVITTPVYDGDVMEGWLAGVLDHGIKRPIVCSVGVLRSARGARLLRERAPWVALPDRVIERLERNGDADSQRAAGRELALEVIDRLRGLEGVAGVNIVGLGQEEAVPDLIRESGLR